MSSENRLAMIIVETFSDLLNLKGVMRGDIVKVYDTGIFYVNVTGENNSDSWLKFSQPVSPLMKFDPAFGTRKPNIDNVDMYREKHPKRAWLFNPWTGVMRHPNEIGTDILGFSIIPPTQ